MSNVCQCSRWVCGVQRHGPAATCSRPRPRRRSCSRSRLPRSPSPELTAEAAEISTTPATPAANHPATPRPAPRPGTASRGRRAPSQDTTAPAVLPAGVAAAQAPRLVAPAPGLAAPAPRLAAAAATPSPQLAAAAAVPAASQAPTRPEATASAPQRRKTAALVSRRKATARPDGQRHARRIAQMRPTPLANAAVATCFSRRCLPRGKFDSTTSEDRKASICTQMRRTITAECSLRAGSGGGERRADVVSSGVSSRDDSTCAADSFRVNPSAGTLEPASPRRHDLS